MLDPAMPDFGEVMQARRWRDRKTKTNMRAMELAVSRSRRRAVRETQL